MNSKFLKDNWLWIALGLGAVYVIWKGAHAVTDSVATAAAKIYTWLALPGQVTVTGKYVLPDYSLISPTSVSTYWVGNSLRFKLQGAEYELSPHDARGNYPATRIA